MRRAQKRRDTEFFFFKQKTAYEISACLVGSEMCIRDRVTGISMMLTAQGADHTAGNLFNIETKDKSTQELTDASMEVQALCGAADSLGLCVFGRSVTNINQDLIINALNDALGTEFDTSFYLQLGQETLEMETAFNEAAGFSEMDDELPTDDGEVKLDELKVEHPQTIREPGIKE